ncbi:hypothetical protein BH10ACI4_BH10ACI4_24930 [soil metagenome]
MVKIRSTTIVQAPIERCFSLTLSTEIHRAATGDVPLNGVVAGLLGPGRTVTWKTPYLRMTFEPEILIDAWRPFTYYREVMVSGPLESWEHEYHFAPMNDGTRIRDEIRFTAPMGRLGRLAESLFLRRHLTARLVQRNAFIKRVAESEDWHQYLDGQPEIDLRVYQAAQRDPEPQGRVYAG